jgi:hypothetical protein
MTRALQPARGLKPAVAPAALLASVAAAGAVDGYRSPAVFSPTASASGGWLVAAARIHRAPLHALTRAALAERGSLDVFLDQVVH